MKNIQSNNDLDLSAVYSQKLLNNAFDFIFPSVNLFKEISEYNSAHDRRILKAAFISSVTGIELLLKAKIIAKDWKAIIKNEKKIATYQNFIDADFHSIDLSKCISMIEKLYVTVLDPDFKKKIEKLRLARNKFVHFDLEIDRENFISFLSTSIDAFLSFYSEHFVVDFDENRNIAREIDYALVKIKSYVDMRIRTLNLEVLRLNFKRPLTHHLSACYRCEQDTLVIMDNDIVCLYCHNKIEIRELAAELSENPSPPKNCNNCGCISMMNNQKDTDCWECILCGFFTKTPTRFILLSGKCTENSIR